MAIWGLTLVVVVTFPLAYVIYNVVTFLMDVRRRAYYINKFPGREPHPLWGHLHEVSILISLFYYFGCYRLFIIKCLPLYSTDTRTTLVWIFFGSKMSPIN